MMPKRQSALFTALFSSATALGLLALQGLTVPQAQANDYAVKGFKYHNAGGYTAEPRGKYKFKDASGNKVECTVQRKNDGLYDVVGSGKTISIDMRDVSGRTGGSSPDACRDENGLVVPEGAEIWAVVRIEMGDNGSCRKDGTKFYFHPDGDWVTYKTAGTTRNNNRCKIEKRPKTRWPMPQPK